MLGAIMDMFPSWWRWREAFWTVVEKASLKTWFGLKLGWDYFTESKAPEWKIALPRPLGEGYPQVSGVNDFKKHPKIELQLFYFFYYLMTPLTLI